MSTTIQVKPKSDEVPSSKSANNSTGPLGSAPADEENAHSSDHEDYVSSIKNVESLKRRFTEMSETGSKASYTILLVGGGGVGKSLFVEFIANVLQWKDINDYDLDVLNPANEQDGSGNQSQTNPVHLYEFTSKSGIVVRILDTPGFPEKRGIQNSDFYKRTIATQVVGHTNYITAVLIFANGTVPRGGSYLHYAIPTLSAISPNSLANSAFMFTNVADPLAWNFCQDAVPEVFKDAPQFRIDNPVALQRKYLELKHDPKMETEAAKLFSRVKASEQNALKTLEDVFVWLDGLERQPITRRQVRGGLEWVKNVLRTTWRKMQEMSRAS